jgi:hypothetical protein
MQPIALCFRVKRHPAHVPPMLRFALPKRHRRTVGSPTRRQTTVARSARGEHRRTDSAQELRPRREYRSCLLRHLDIRLLAASVLTVVPTV